jgi:anti-sigma regulatory factor (Ser/Thr protein kinase)
VKIAAVATPILLTRNPGGEDGYRHNLPLEHDLDLPIIVDASRVETLHPMFAVRLRMFIDWHLAAGHELRVVSPADARAVALYTDMRVFAELPEDVVRLAPSQTTSEPSVLPVRHLASFHDAEDAAEAATEVLAQQAAPLAIWGDAMHMAMGELCDNALQHGANDLGAYVAADRIQRGGRQFRLVVADLGIGIPEHIRAYHPEWLDDTAAIGRALVRGVTGTGDPHRGNGFAEVFDVALENQLIRQMSSALIDIRAGKGRVSVELVGGEKKVVPMGGPGRRGTWITYTVTSI